MNEVIERILVHAKAAYRESVLIENGLLEEHLLSIIGDATSILNKTHGHSGDSEDNEIQKVHRKLPRWLRNKSQYNYIILKTFMTISAGNARSVNVEELRERSGLPIQKFNSHYSQMKNISDRNHAKVFEETSGVVELWQPVKDFIVETFQNEA